ncbi:MAG: hypothetical protein IJ463_07060 [Bacilli bacterium]|nr:hypothetical protein [Bacilli bacterium]
MSLKDKLSKLRESLVNLGVVGSRDYEFNGVFEDHPIGNQDTYRLYYVDYHRINEYNGCDKNNIGMIDYPLKPFKFPEGMSREDGFKVLSYLTDDIEKQPDVGPYSLKAVRTLDKVLDLERFGFTRVEESDEEKILNLFTVTGRLLLFQKSKLYPKYFEWYTEGISRREVERIYANLGLEFKDVVWTDEEESKTKPKIFEKKC